MRTILFAIFIPIFITFLFFALEKSKEKHSSKCNEDYFTIVVPNVVALIGGTCTGMSTIVMLAFSVFSKVKPIAIFYIVFGVFSWLGTYLMVKTWKWRVVVKQSQVTVYPL